MMPSKNTRKTLAVEPAALEIAGKPEAVRRNCRRTRQIVRSAVRIRMGDILDPMTTRLFALVLALAVVSAPVALEICQITCASNVTPPSTSKADDHALHHHLPADHASGHQHGSTYEQLSPGSIPCDHGTQATPSLVASRNSGAAVSLLAVVPIRFPVATGETRDSVSVRESASDRIAAPFAIPLRV